MSYQAPVKDMLFCVTELAGLEQVPTLPGFEEAGLDTAQAVLATWPPTNSRCRWSWPSAPG